MYTWGGDKGGLELGFPMLGYGVETDWTQREKSVKGSDIPQLVKALDNKFVMTIACGGFHTACVDGGWMAGCADLGQMLESCLRGASLIEGSLVMEIALIPTPLDV